MHICAAPMTGRAAQHRAAQTPVAASCDIMEGSGRAAVLISGEDGQGQAAVMLLEILSEANVSGFSNGQVNTAGGSLDPEITPVIALGMCNGRGAEECPACWAVTDSQQWRILT